MASNQLPLPPLLSEALKVTAVDEGVYSVDLPSSFCFGPRVFGGTVMYILQQAAKEYFIGAGRNQHDVLSMQLQFPRMLYPESAQITFKDIHIGRGASTVHVTVEQDEEACVLGYINMSDLGISKGMSLETGWHLEPLPIEASLSKLATHSDPRWVSYQCPYHPESFRRIQSYVQYHVPYEMQDRSIKDHWIRPSDPRTKWTNETIGFIADFSLPVIDNFFPDTSIGSHGAVIAAALKQKEEWEKGILGHDGLDESSGAYDTPATYMSLNVTLEIHKKLPADGVDWLFLRTRARIIKDGRMNLDVVILDETGDVIALSTQLCQIIDLRRASKTKPRL